MQDEICQNKCEIYILKDIIESRLTQIPIFIYDFNHTFVNPENLSTS